MGSIASSNTPVGAPANPRVLYNEKLSKKDKKNYKIDTPVLVDLEHGSVRYRFGKYDGEPSRKSRRVERPFEGDEKVNKQHYFFHTRLNDFSESATPSKEDPHKFLVVAKGPASAHQKKLFYVYGKGWNAMDGKRTMPTLSKEDGHDYAWPEMRKPNDVYYNLSFNVQDGELTEEVTEEDRLINDLSSTADRSKIQLTLTAEDTAHDVKKKLAYKILKSAENIHVFHQRKQELRNEDVIGDLRQEEDGTWTNFTVTISLF